MGREETGRTDHSGRGGGISEVMNQAEFFRNLSAAIGLKILTRNPSFYDGYIRGLRRCYHGENFGTEEEHREWMSLADETGDEKSKISGLGYRQGLSGEPIFDIIKKIAA